MDMFGNSRLPSPPPVGGGGFNNYAAGRKHYGGGRNAPNIGPVANLIGYRKRDLKRSALQDAIARKLKAQDTGNPMNFNYLNFIGGGSS